MVTTFFAPRNQTPAISKRTTARKSVGTTRTGGRKQSGERKDAGRDWKSIQVGVTHR